MGACSQAQCTGLQRELAGGNSEGLGRVEALPLVLESTASTAGALLGTWGDWKGF